MPFLRVIFEFLKFLKYLLDGILNSKENCTLEFIEILPPSALFWAISKNVLTERQTERKTSEVQTQPLLSENKKNGI